MKMLAYFFSGWNAVVFLLYGFDKLAAKTGGRRVPEKALLSCAFLMGGAGAGFGMLLFHHKTRKYKFTIGVPLALLVNIAAGAAVMNIFI